MANRTQDVREGYVALIQNLQESRQALLDDEDGLNKAYEEANKLYNSVKTKNAREQALDSQALSLISKLSVDKLEQFRTDIKEKKDPKVFLTKLRSWCAAEPEGDKDKEDAEDATQVKTNARSSQRHAEIDWTLLGRNVVPFVNTTPTTDFMYGLLDVPEKQKKTVRKQTKPNKAPAKLIQAQEGIDTTNQVGKETTKYIKKMHKTIQSSGNRPFYDTVINPRDFGQTVENIFYLSFLVKDGHTKIKLDQNNLPIVASSRQPTADDYARGEADRRQCVVKLDFPLWHKIKEERNITEPFFEERDYSKLLKDTSERRARVQKRLEEHVEEEEEDEDVPEPVPEQAPKPASKITIASGNKSKHNRRGEAPNGSQNHKSTSNGESGRSSRASSSSQKEQQRPKRQSSQRRIEASDDEEDDDEDEEEVESDPPAKVGSKRGRNSSQSSSQTPSKRSRIR